jgi:hypothetical protein
MGNSLEGPGNLLEDCEFLAEDEVEAFFDIENCITPIERDEIVCTMSSGLKLVCFT